MISTEIEFFKPSSVAEALGLLAEHGDEVTILSGGMSLLPMMNLGLATPERVLSLNGIDDLRYIRDDGDALVIGARTRHVDVGRDPRVRQHAPLLAESATRIGDVQVRNRGTIGGSISHADPSADYLPALTAAGASIRLERASTSPRELAVGEFFVDLMYTSRQPEELLTAVRVPKIGPGAGSAYIRFARVEGSFAIVNAAAVVRAPGRPATLGMGGIATTPVLLDITEQGRDGWDEGALEAIGDLAFEASSGASGDAMSDAEYKREMARVHARRVVRLAAQRLDAA